jgi:hypothetical protein
MRKKPGFMYIFSVFFMVARLNMPARPVSTASVADVTYNQPTLNFPDSITFQVTIESQTPINSVELEYGTTQLTCGTVVAKAFPKFTAGTSISSAWTWEMKQSGSLPPGATVWWRWRYTDSNNAEYVTERQTVTWLDAKHEWQTISSGLVYLHWYYGEQVFAQDLLDAALTGLTRLQEDAGLQPDKPVQLYIYANSSDMQEAILYEPSWTGGIAFPEHDIVLIGIAPGDIAWGRSTIAHELTHVLVGHQTFSCLGGVPTWLNEGLAVYAEGELDPASAEQLNQAIITDQLLPVRSLSGGFSEVPGRAYLSYSQSYSLVHFLIENYGQDRMDSLLLALRDGSTIDTALRKVYGFDVEGLEEAWREAVGAPSKTASVRPTAQPTPTFIPTYAPFAGVPLAVTTTPYSIPTSSFGEQGNPANGPPLSLTLMLVAVCCVLLLLLGVIGLGLYLSTQKNKEGRNETLQ